MGFEWNKIFGALLACAFVVLGVNFLSDGLFHTENPEKQGYAIEGGAIAAVGGGDDKAEGVESVSAMLATMEISEGQKIGKKCVACHNFDKGGANKVGPALYNIVNRPVASVDGFGYSGALKAYAEGGKTWTYDELNGFLYKPKAHVKGTSMGFAGLKKTGDRAAMIAYLRSLADTMAPLPDSAEAKPAEGGAAATDTPTNDATIVTPAPSNGTATGASGGATGTELTPKVEGGTTEEAPKTEETPKAEEPKAEEGTTQSN